MSRRGRVALVTALAMFCIVAAPSGAAAPTWPRGEVIAYKCADSLCLTDPSTGVRRRLLASTRPWPQWDPALSPTGQQIAFRGYYEPGSDGAYALYVAPISGCAAKRVTRGVAGDPTWSPDGGWIAYDTSGYGDIYKVRPNGTGLTELFVGHGINEGWYPAWSPDGRWIAFVVDRRRGSEIWLMRPDGSDKHRLHTDTTAVDQSLAWSHDGRLLAFVRSPATDHGSIAVIRTDGTNVRTLTRATPAWNPVWLPNDAGIAYLTTTPLANGDLGPARVHAMRTDGSDKHTVAGPRTIQFTSTSGRMTARGCP